MEDARDWRKLEFVAPIESFSGNNDEFMIEGTAINATTTRNGTSYLAEELEPSAKTLRDKPILKDHNNSVDSIIGRTTNKVGYNSEKAKIDFQARIVDEAIQKKIKQGLIKDVSVGAIAKDIEMDEESGDLIVRGITFVELSLVAVPADPNANFAQAMMESWDIKQQESKTNTSSTDNVIANIKLSKEAKMSDDKTTQVNEELEKIKVEQEAQKKILAEKDAELARLKEELDNKAVAEQLVKEQTEKDAREKVLADKDAEIATLQAENVKAQELITKNSSALKGKVNNEQSSDDNTDSGFVYDVNESKVELTVNDYSAVEGLNRLTR